MKGTFLLFFCILGSSTLIAQELKVTTGTLNEAYKITNTPVLILPKTVSETALKAMTAINDKELTELFNKNYIRSQNITDQYDLSLNPSYAKNIDKILSNPIKDKKALDYIYFTNSDGEIRNLKISDQVQIFTTIDTQIKSADVQIFDNKKNEINIK